MQHASILSATPRITLVTEAYNLAEGQSEAAFVGALYSVERIGRRTAGVEVIVLDPTPGHIAAPIIGQHCPGLRCLHVPGKSYDGQKNAAALAARGEFLVFLDGDCVPRSDDWLERLLAPFDDPGVHAVGGLTLYAGDDVTAKAMSVLDFGFLFEPDARGHLGCYASNNVTFRRAAYLQVMAPDDGLLRSYCYKHAQLLARAGMPVHVQPEARVLHELPDVEKERLRRGYDHVAALWADPWLGLARDVRGHRAFAHRTLDQQTALALARLRIAPPSLGVTPDNAATIAREIERLMRLDRRGVLQALAIGEAEGWNARTRAAHARLASPPRRGLGRGWFGGGTVQRP